MPVHSLRDVAAVTREFVVVQLCSTGQCSAAHPHCQGWKAGRGRGGEGRMRNGPAGGLPIRFKRIEAGGHQSSWAIIAAESLSRDATDQPTWSQAAVPSSKLLHTTLFTNLVVQHREKTNLLHENNDERLNPATTAAICLAMTLTVIIYKIIWDTCSFMGSVANIGVVTLTLYAT